jgi:hypothetical protein
MSVNLSRREHLYNAIFKVKLFNCNSKYIRGFQDSTR